MRDHFGLTAVSRALVELVVEASSISVSLGFEVVDMCFEYETIAEDNAAAFKLRDEQGGERKQGRGHERGPRRGERTQFTPRVNL